MTDLVEELRQRHQGARGSRQATREAAAAEIERLRTIEKAARRFLKEADESPRYVTVRTWATAEADPYQKLRAAVGPTNVTI